jgi:ASC-1-like (ASCH) protein
MNTELPKLRERKEFDFEFTIQAKYLHFIIGGIKTSEGRINSGQFSQIQVGNKVRFYNQKSRSYAICEILSKNEYSSFKEMIIGEGLENMLPDCKSVDVGVGVYNSIPTYADRCIKNGCLGLGIRVLSYKQ